jgi:hypothetical protein
MQEPGTTIIWVFDDVFTRKTDRSIRGKCQDFQAKEGWRGLNCSVTGGHLTPQEEILVHDKPSTNLANLRFRWVNAMQLDPGELLDG